MFEEIRSLLRANEQRHSDERPPTGNLVEAVHNAGVRAKRDRQRRIKIAQQLDLEPEDIAAFQTLADSNRSINVAADRLGLTPREVSDIAQRVQFALLRDAAGRSQWTDMLGFEDMLGIDPRRKNESRSDTAETDFE
ncbi:MULTISPECIES: hypothetical protein [unclassified Nocardioides]|uniref:hypothetical protein n=1 Tax=unclassified Nocardioides TaxID=2615069 RepID=UPI001056D2E5|nr:MULTISPECIES: hypothetical protein [unclassified Nocardioides]